MNPTVMWLKARLCVVLCLFLCSAVTKWDNERSCAKFRKLTPPPPHTPTMARAAWLSRHPDHRTTLGTTPLDEWSARRWDVYLAAHNTHRRRTSVPWRGIRAHSRSERPQTPRLRPHGHWAQQILELPERNSMIGY
jgi:hypothetical protein